MPATPSDPTANVIRTLEDAVKRSDDLRTGMADTLSQRLDGMNQGIRLQVEIAKLRADHNRELIVLQAAHQAALDDKEARRLDSVRAVDQLASKTESERAATAITALATAAATKDETLRSAVNTSAVNLATQLDRTISEIKKDIASLRESRSQDLGRAGIADPVMAELMHSVKDLVGLQERGSGKSAGVNMVWVAIIGVVSVLTSIAAVILTVIVHK